MKKIIYSYIVRPESSNAFLIKFKSSLIIPLGYIILAVVNGTAPPSRLINSFKLSVSFTSSNKSEDIPTSPSSDPKITASLS